MSDPLNYHGFYIKICKNFAEKIQVGYQLDRHQVYNSSANFDYLN